MFCSFGQPYQTCFTTLAQRLVSIDTASCLRTSLVQYFKDCEQGRRFGERSEIGEIEIEEKQSKGKATKSIVVKCMQVQQASVSRENRHKSFASFRGNLEYHASIISSCAILL